MAMPSVYRDTKVKILQRSMVAIEDIDPNHIKTVMTLLCSQGSSTELASAAFWSNNILDSGGSPGPYRLKHLFHSVKQELLVFRYFHVGHLSKQ